MYRYGHQDPGSKHAARLNPPAITLGGEEIAVPIVRSLAHAGVEVHAAGGDTTYDTVGFSRYCSTYANLGRGSGIVERYLDWLAADAPRGAVLLPCNDDALELLLRHGTELAELGFLSVEGEPETLAAMLDKRKSSEIARRAGLATPRMWVSDDGDLDGAVAEIGFPCAIKPLYSHRFAHVYGAKLLVADDRRQLDDGLARTRELGLEMAVVEIIAGPETELLSYCGYLDQRGEPIAHFTFRKIRQFPIHFGRGCYVVSDWNEGVAAAGIRFLREAGLRGLFHVEFKRDPRDGRLKLLECNHRFTIEALLAPADLPLLAYNRALGRPPPPPRPYRTGVHLWSPVRDARAFLSYYRRGELTIGRWLRSLLHRQTFHRFQWSDPQPALRAQLGLLTRALRRARRRSHSGPHDDPAVTPRD